MTRMNWDRLRLRDCMIYNGSANGREPNYRVPPPPPGKSTLSFHGEFRVLKKLMALTECQGEWSKSGKVRVFRTTDGAVMNWRPQSGKIWFQGKYEPRTDLQSALEFQMSQWKNCANKKPSHSRPSEFEVIEALRRFEELPDVSRPVVTRRMAR